MRMQPPQKVQAALEFTYRKKKDKLTRDVGGEAGTTEFADAVIESMEQPVAAAQ
jgi:isocitrate dehydrogenase (NAD+)